MVIRRVSGARETERALSESGPGRIDLEALSVHTALVRGYLGGGLQPGPEPPGRCGHILSMVNLPSPFLSSVFNAAAASAISLASITPS